jgi:thiol-disulfide isomerase/thioredoxin
MNRTPIAACVAIFLASTLAARAQVSKSATPAPKSPADTSAQKEPDAEEELQKALANAGNDSAALIRNLKDYLRKFPDAPRKASVYRALVEACQQTRDDTCALEYGERLIALRPDDSQMMLLAVNLLQRQGDEASLTRASGYVTRVLDRIEKALPDEKPANESLAEWQDGQAQLRTALYYVRGRVEDSQHNFSPAIKDLQTSYSIRPNAAAAEALGEIAERQRDFETAIDQYGRAFVLPENGPAGSVNRLEVRRKLGNVWRQVHGSDQGLGEAILEAYDRISSPAPVATGNPAARNKNAKEFLAFTVRRLDGTLLPLAPFNGKIVALSFWATWCVPCREVEPMFDQVAKAYEGNPDVKFLTVNIDDDEAAVPSFVAREKWDIPVIYADGLDTFLRVDTLPTVLVLGRNGEIAYRARGSAPDGFAESLTNAIQTALGSGH